MICLEKRIPCGKMLVVPGKVYFLTRKTELRLDLNIYKNAEYQRDVEVSHSEIIHAIKDLKDNKSCGLDGISAVHLKHCSGVVIPLLSMCFTSLFVHGILPESMISVVLVPIVKNKNASICSKSNYRPIALASMVSKVFIFLNL